ncbi:MAG TPA: hypothetical protein VJV74_12050 [Terriglobia bacterium]|nr:hypothetical protein [Terriglobia bacterium]
MSSRFEIVCPCCGARLKVDAELSRIIAHEAPPKRSQAPALEQAGDLLQKEAARREAHFRQSAEDERVRSRLLERKFEEALSKTKDEPVVPPTRDIDLD